MKTKPKTEKRRIEPVLLTVIFLLGLFLRFQYANTVQIDNPLRADAAQYAVYGYNVAHHGVFSNEYAPSPRPDSFRSPGYPFFIALCFMLGGDEGFYRVVIYAQALIGALLILLTYFMAVHFLPSGAIERQAFFAKWGAILSAALVAISPHLISMISYVLTETLFGFVLAASILFFILGMKRGSIFYFGGSGICFGYAYLVNETAFFIPFVLAVPILAKKRAGHFEETGGVIKWRAIIIFLLAFSIFPVCWTVRNAVNVQSDSLKGSARACFTMSTGAYPGFVHSDPKFKYYPYREDPMQPEFGSSFKNFGKILWSRVKQRPLRYLSWYFLEKPYYIWSWDNLQSQTAGKPKKGTGDIYVYPVKTSLYYESALANLSRIFMKILHPVILLSALSGIFLFIFFRRKEEFSSFPWPLLAVIGYYTFLYSVFAPWPRYSVPLRPELYLFAVWSANRMWTLFVRN